MIVKINNLPAAIVLLGLFKWAVPPVSNGDQFLTGDGFHNKMPRLQDAVFLDPQNYPNFTGVNQETEKWNLTVDGFSDAYFDRARGAIAVNTIEQPTDRWAAASTLFKQPSGRYTLRFTSLLESDGESYYKVFIDDKLVLEFQNPIIYGKDIAEYAPHVVEVMDVVMVRGGKIQVEFLPHSNGLVPEGDGFGYARARWSNNIEFIPQ